MTKGYCRCGNVMDETEFTTNGVCDECFEKGFTKVDGDAWERYFRSRNKIKKFNPLDEKLFWELG